MSRTNNDYWVYIVSSNTRSTLYIGVTSELRVRIWQHRTGAKPGSFAQHYHCGHLVYFEHLRERSNSEMATFEKECADRHLESALG